MWLKRLTSLEASNWDSKFNFILFDFLESPPNFNFPRNEKYSSEKKQIDRKCYWWRKFSIISLYALARYHIADSPIVIQCITTHHFTAIFFPRVGRNKWHHIYFINHFRFFFLSLSISAQFPFWIQLMAIIWGCEWKEALSKFAD
jgi:hypothetical protein